MQEFYSSKEIGIQVELKDIPKLTPGTWWREAILLHAAQLKDPSELLSLLFKSDPILAIAAVAECPTPSIDAQNEAVSHSLLFIDKKDQTIKGSLIPLLRKLKDNIEVKLYSELEKRLTMDEQISSIVGVSLAIAGTSSATNILAKHPEIWHICLNEAGYLSTSFENLLVEWIQEGENSNSFKAADLLSKKITSDRIIQLVKIIPTLNKKKKEHLSRLLLKELATKSIPRDLENYDELSLISELIPNVSSPNQFISEITDQKRQHTRRNPYYRSSLIPSIIIAFFLKNKNSRCSSNEIMSVFTNGILWQTNKKSLMLWLVSANMFLLLNFDQPTLILIVFSFISISYILLYLSRQQHYPYLISHYSFVNFNTKQISYILFYLLGSLSALIIFDFLMLFQLKILRVFA